jgi:hypothetical protein
MVRLNEYLKTNAKASTMVSSAHLNRPIDEQIQPNNGYLKRKD